MATFDFLRWQPSPLLAIFDGLPQPLLQDLAHFLVLGQQGKILEGVVTTTLGRIRVNGPRNSIETPTK